MFAPSVRLNTARCSWRVSFRSGLISIRDLVRYSFTSSKAFWHWGSHWKFLNPRRTSKNGNAFLVDFEMNLKRAASLSGQLLDVPTIFRCLELRVEVSRGYYGLFRGLGNMRISESRQAVTITQQVSHGLWFSHACLYFPQTAPNVGTEFLKGWLARTFFGRTCEKRMWGIVPLILFRYENKLISVFVSNQKYKSCVYCKCVYELSVFEPDSILTRAFPTYRLVTIFQEVDVGCVDHVLPNFPTQSQW